MPIIKKLNFRMDLVLTDRNTGHQMIITGEPSQLSSILDAADAAPFFEWTDEFLKQFEKLDEQK